MSFNLGQCVYLINFYDDFKSGSVLGKKLGHQVNFYNFHHSRDYIFLSKSMKLSHNLYPVHIEI